MRKSMYQSVYERLCPDDILERDDPRRPAIIAEMKDIAAAKTDIEAVKVVEWWGVWPNEQHATALEFVQQVRRLLSPGEA